MTHTPTPEPVRAPALRRRGGPPRRAAAALVAALLAFVLAVDAQAAPSFLPDSLTTVAGTVVDYMDQSASQAASPACYTKGSDPDHSFNCALQALRQTGLDAELASMGPYTLFAPTDTAFKELASLMGASAFRRLLRDSERLTTVMRNHVVSGKLTTRALAARASGATGKARLQTIAGNQLVIEFHRFPPTGRASAKVGTARSQPWQPYIVDNAVLATDGVLIPIDMVVLPPGF